MKRGWILLVILVFSLLCALPPAQAKADQTDEVRKLWNEIRKKWDTEVNNYTTNIFSWAYRTKWYIDHLPPKELLDESGKKLEEDWVYRIYGVKFKKPGKVLLSYDYSEHEPLDKGSLINRAIAYTLKYIPGALLNYGWLDEEKIYVKFPYVGTREVLKMKIPIQWRVMMTALVIASRNEVYWKFPKDLKDPRGSDITMVIIGKTMDKFEHYFKIDDGTVESYLTKAPRLSKDYYKLKKDGWVEMKKGALDREPKELLMITLIDRNIERCRGVNKKVAFIDPEMKMFVGYQEYENDKLVGVYHFYNIEVNVDLPDKLWSDYFKDRKISDRK
ncbi:MAG: hypothetical protein AB1546_11885 [bacterium]